MFPELPMREWHGNWNSRRNLTPCSRNSSPGWAVIKLKCSIWSYATFKKGLLGPNKSSAIPVCFALSENDLFPTTAGLTALLGSNQPSGFCPEPRISLRMFAHPMIPPDLLAHVKWSNQHALCESIHLVSEEDTWLTDFDPPPFRTLPHHQDIGRFLERKGRRWKKNK